MTSAEVRLLLDEIGVAITRKEGEREAAYEQMMNFRRLLSSRADDELLQRQSVEADEWFRQLAPGLRELRAERMRLKSALNT